MNDSGAKKFLHMSHGVLALAISGMFLFCCVGPILFCLFAGVLGASTDTGSTPSY